MEIMNNYKWKGKNKSYIWVLISIILSGTILRIYWMFNHFTHYDDVGLILCLVELKKRQGSLMEYMGWAWTYAPLQVFLSGLLVKPEYTYITNLVLGRLPSCISGILLIVFTYLMIGKVFKNSKYCKIAQLLSTALTAFSWENIIYSAQAEPYEIGVLGIVFLIMCLTEICETKKIAICRLVLLSVFILYSQYHSAIFLVAFYSAVFFIVDKKNKLYLFLSALVSAIFCMPLMYSFLSRGMLARGTNWNVGVNGEFLFPEVRSAFSLVDSLIWFSKNAHIYIQNFFISNLSGNVILILTITFSSLCLLGFIALHYYKKRYLGLVLFVDFSMIIFIFLFVARKLAFSPSRHTLLFYPIVLIFFCKGLDLLLNTIKSKNLRSAIVGIWGSLMLVTYIQTSLVEFPLRKNLLFGNEVERLLDKYKPTSIIAYSCFDLRLMSLPDYELVNGPDPLWINTYASKRSDKSDYIMLVGIGRAIDQGLVDNMETYWYDIPKDTFKDLDQINQNVIDGLFIGTGTEVEYAKGYFSNAPNDLYIYILNASGARR